MDEPRRDRTNELVLGVVGLWVAVVVVWAALTHTLPVWLAIFPLLAVFTVLCLASIAAWLESLWRRR